MDWLTRIDTWVTVAILVWVAWQFGSNPIKFLYELFILPIFGAPRKPAQSVAQPAQAPRMGAPMLRIDAPDYAQLSRSESDWLRVLNAQPDVNPHLAVCGPTRSGKTTLVMALIAQRPGDLVICTPKGADTDPWGGFPAVRLAYNVHSGDVSYAPIGAAIRAVYQEMNRRNAVPGASRAPLTLVIDELTNVSAELKADGCMDMILRMWTMAASCGIRLITLDPTVNVRGWGIEGRGDVRENLVFVRCQPDKSATYYRWGSEAAPMPIDTLLLPGMAARGLDPVRVWVPPTRADVAQTAPVAGLWSAPNSRDLTDHERTQIRQWAGDDGKASRALARRLYEARGGDAGGYDGSGAPFQACQQALTSNVS